MRVVVADDALLVRRGIVGLLGDAGIEVVGEAGDVAGVIDTVATTRPDVVVLDIRMPPTFTDEGVRAAQQIRRTDPALGVVLLSQYVDVSVALRILDRDERGMAYVLKDRVTDLTDLVDTIERVAAGGTVVDASIAEQLVDSVDRTLGLQAVLSFRELRILALIAAGWSDRAIAAQLLISPKTVETHVSKVFRKLGLVGSIDTNRRVHATLRYLSDAR